jgi:hypothetical protein
MTEAEWVACDDPDVLLKKSHFRLFRRKSRLFAVACCRCTWPTFVDDRSRHAVEVAERHADGMATDEELQVARHQAAEAHAELFAVLGKVGSTIEWAAEYATDLNPLHAAKTVIWMARWPRLYEHPREFGEAPHLTPCTVESRTGFSAALVGKWKMIPLSETVPTGAGKAVECRLIRDVFPNPFRPVPFSPEWRTATAVALSRQQYDSRNFSAMPILADALQDAGCDNADILDHCRGPGPHVRGCWVVDLVLGKE